MTKTVCQEFAFFKIIFILSQPKRYRKQHNFTIFRIVLICKSIRSQSWPVFFLRWDTPAICPV